MMQILMFEFDGSFQKLFKKKKREEKKNEADSFHPRENHFPHQVASLHSCFFRNWPAINTYSIKSELLNTQSTIPNMMLMMMMMMIFLFHACLPNEKKKA